MNRIFCISGLGADERIFSKLTLPGVSLIPLQWIRPEKKEGIEAYARRMTSQLPPPPYSYVPTTTSQVPSHPTGQEDQQVHGDGPPPTFMGVSFGGMMALEIAKYYTNAKVILISSVKSRKELPGWMRLAGSLHLNKLLPHNPPRWSRLESDFLGTETEEETQLVREFMKTADPVYLRWAMGQVISWQNQWQPPSCFHIHGSNDKTFPLKNIRATHVIGGGGHFMVLNRAKEVSAIIESILGRKTTKFL